MYIKIDKIQHNVKSAYHEPIHLRKNIIQACQGYLILAAGLINPLPKTSDMVNFLYSSIINYEKVHKSSFIENYVHSENNWEDDEIFFTNW